MDTRTRYYTGECNWGKPIERKTLEAQLVLLSQRSISSNPLWGPLISCGITKWLFDVLGYANATCQYWRASKGHSLQGFPFKQKGMLDDAVGWVVVLKACRSSGMSSNPHIVIAGECMCKWIIKRTHTWCTLSTHAGPRYSQQVHVASVCSRVYVAGAIIGKGACEFLHVCPLSWLTSRLDTLPCKTKRNEDMN